MSGTSADGIDVAVIRTDGASSVERLGGISIPYNTAMTKALLQAASDHTAAPDLITALTHLHAEAVSQGLANAEILARDVDIIGFHGHTIDHAPQEKRTVQIGDAALLAQLCQCDVVGDFRQNDVASGGQGAPLVPIYHQALAQDLPKPLAVVNIGGVANVTYIDASEHLLAFDTGAGNALLNDWIMRHTAAGYDDNGQIAAGGKANEHLLTNWLQHPYFTQQPPKSLDRNAFTLDLDGLSLADGAATLTAFTARSIAAAVQHFPVPPQQWIIVGGGRHNPTLLQQLALCVNAHIATGEDVGWNSDLLEAEAFAYLAVRNLKGLPLSFPGTTGVAVPLTGGKIFPYV